MQNNRRRVEAERAARQQAALDARARQNAVFDSFMAKRDYDGALYFALYQSRSKEQAETAVMAASRAGAMGSVFEDHLYVLEYWFPTGPIAGITASEMARRKRGSDCGIWNCTNMPGAAERRWQAQNRSSSSGYSSSARSSSSSFQPKRMLSSAEISQQTRDRYRSYNCTGSRRLSSSHPACQ